EVALDHGHRPWVGAPVVGSEREQARTRVRDRGRLVEVVPAACLQLAVQPLTRDYARHQGVPPRRLPGQRLGYARPKSPGAWDATTGAIRCRERCVGAVTSLGRRSRLHSDRTGTTTSTSY